MRFLKLLGLFFTTAVFAQTVPVNSDKVFQYAQANENYVKNSSCLKNVANITASGGSLTRNTTTPLGRAGADCAIDASANAQTYDFLTDTKPTSLSGACLATFFYSGDATLYTAEVFDGSNTISPITTLLSVGSTGQRFEVGYSCAASARVRISSTSASAAAINVVEVFAGRDYRIGALNGMETIVSATRITTTQTISTTAATTLIWNSDPVDKYSEMDTTTGVFTSKKSRRLTIYAQAGFSSIAERVTVSIQKNSVDVCFGASQHVQSLETTSSICVFNVVAGDTVRTQTTSVADASYTFNNFGSENLIIKEEPLASETVLRGDVTDLSGTLRNAGTANCIWAGASATFASFAADADCPTPTVSGNAAAPATKIPAISVPNLTPGRYLILAQTSLYFNPQSTAGTGICDYRINDGTTSGPVLQLFGDVSLGRPTLSAISGVFEYSANQTNKVFEIQYRLFSGNQTTCRVANDSAELEWTIIPLSSQVAKPFIPSSVFAGRQSIAKIGAANLNLDAGSAIITNDDSMVASLGNISSGDTTITLSTGYFSSAPICQVTTDRSISSARILGVSSASATSITVKCITDAGADCTGVNIQLFCIGNN